MRKCAFPGFGEMMGYTGAMHLSPLAPLVKCPPQNKNQTPSDVVVQPAGCEPLSLTVTAGGLEAESPLNKLHCN